MRIVHLLFLLFLAVPVLEIYLLIQVGGIIGALPTVALLVFTAIAGAVLMRQQGFATLARARASLMRGELPAVELLEGLVILVCGALLLTPGFFTDVLGFIGLLPPVRRFLIRRWLRRAVVGVVTPRTPDRRGSHTIEGEFRREE